MYSRAEAISELESKALLGKAQLFIDMQDYPAALVHLRRAVSRYPELYDLNKQIEIIENIIRMKDKTTI